MARQDALGEVDDFEYILKGNRKDPVEDQVTYLLIGLTSRERTLARNALVSDAPTMDALDLTVSLGLKGWENLKHKNKKGDLVELKWPGNGRLAVPKLGEAIIQELAMEIMRASEIGDHEKGN